MKLRDLHLFLFMLFAPALMAQAVITVEAPSPDPTLVVRGPEAAVTLFNEKAWEVKGPCIALFSIVHGESIRSDEKSYTAIQVDGNMKVIAVVNGSNGKGGKPVFSDKLDLKIPKGGCVLVASDTDYNTGKYRKSLAENFRIGDVIKFRVNGEVSSLERVITLMVGPATSGVRLTGDYLTTVIGNKVSLKGMITNYNGKHKNQLFAVKGEASTPIQFNTKGEFSGMFSLEPGTNYWDIQLLVDGVEVARQPWIVFSKKMNQQPNELVMWVEQFPNAKTLTNTSAIIDMVAKVKKAGFTSIGLDVKGPEGYVSYRKNDLSGTPYFTATKNPTKQVEDNGLDLLAEIIREAHREGLKVYVSFNFFTEGNITAHDYAILDQHKDWEEIVQRPEDKGKLLKISESSRGKDAAQGKLLALAFVNPSNKEVQDFQLLRVEEVLKNYDVDGIVLDRCRYDNLYADFSHVSRNAFDEYLMSQGKTLDNFPADAFKIDTTGTLVKGKYYKEWITFRSQTISLFTDRIRVLVNTYKAAKNPELKMVAYVGSWYEAYYQNGVNWASGQFQYNDRLGFPESEIYGESYNKTSYLKNLDFLMIGTYYKTAAEVNRYITLGNILTCGELPILGSMSLPDLTLKDQATVFGASMANSSGLMIFDFCYVDWATFYEQMRIALSQKKNNVTNAK